MNSPSLEGGYALKRLDARNLADVERLHRAVYGTQPAPDYFRKKYDTRFAGAQYVGFLAYAGQTPVAFYGVLPCFLEVEGKTVLAAQSADTMTHPGHRNKGLFVQLALLTFQLCRDCGIQVLFGFPNQNSLPGFLGKLAWQSPTSLDYFVIRSGSSLWATLVNRLPVLRSLVMVYRRRVLGKYHDDKAVVNNSVLGDGFYGIRRDAAWSRYKTYNDTHVIRLAEATFWIKASRFILIGDMQTVPENFERALAAMKKLAKALAIRDLYFYACPGTTLHRLLADRGEPTPGFPVIFKVLGGDLPIDRIKFTAADLDVF